MRGTREVRSSRSSPTQLRQLMSSPGAFTSASSEEECWDMLLSGASLGPSGNSCAREAVQFCKGLQSGEQ